MREIQNGIFLLILLYTKWKALTEHYTKVLSNISTSGYIDILVYATTCPYTGLNADTCHSDNKHFNHLHNCLETPTFAVIHV